MKDRMRNPKSCVEYALWYRKSWGWSVIPMHVVLEGGACSCRSVECHKGKHPCLTSWVEFQKRLPTEDEIKNWWARWPWAGIAVVCGGVSGGLAALDIDDAEIAGQIEEQELFTRTERTPRNGLHAFVRTATATKTSVLVSGVAELKGEGGLITVAPSPGYKLLRDVSPIDVEGAREWATKLLEKVGIGVDQSASSTPKGYELLRNKPLTDGARNNVLTSLAGVFHSKGFDPATVSAVLRAINRERCNLPLPEEEVNRIAQSVSRYPVNGKCDSAKLIDISATERKSITLKELIETEPERVDWFWKGFIGPGILTLISAHPKLGKTTLLFHLLKALTSQDTFLGLPIRRAKVLLFSEEPRQRIGSRARQMGIKGEEILVISRFDVPQWSDSLTQIKKGIIEDKVNVIVVDTLASFWNVGDENEATRVIESLRLLQDIGREYNVAILLFHHVRKAPGSEGTAHRGSGALLGTADIGVEVKRVPRKKRRRYLNSLTRYEETPEEMIIELKDDGYHYIGTPAQAGYEGVKTQAIEALPGPKEQAIRRDDLRKKLNPTPSHSLLKKVLNDLVEEGWIEAQGKGRKSSALTYRRKDA